MFSFTQEELTEFIKRIKELSDDQKVRKVLSRLDKNQEHEVDSEPDFTGLLEELQKQNDRLIKTTE